VLRLSISHVIDSLFVRAGYVFVSYLFIYFYFFLVLRYIFFHKSDYWF
jgi:hypothetical protein